MERSHRRRRVTMWIVISAQLILATAASGWSRTHRRLCSAAADSKAP